MNILDEFTKKILKRDLKAYSNSYFSRKVMFWIIYQNKMSQPLKFALVLKERLVEAHSVLVLYGAGSGFESAPG